MTGPTDDECAVTAADGDEPDHTEATPDAGVDEPPTEVPTAEPRGDYEPL